MIHLSQYILRQSDAADGQFLLEININVLLEMNIYVIDTTGH